MTRRETRVPAERVRTAIIGCGKIADLHAIALDRLEVAEFVACCDNQVDRAMALAAKYSAPHVFADVGELFASGLIDAALVCTPHPVHEAVVVAAARAGIHVLCEKPIAITLGEADRMIAAADAAGIKFGVVFQRRFWPAAQRVRAAIDAGKLGTPTIGECNARLWRGPDYFAMDPWRGKWATEGGGVLMNQHVHFIDQLQWFMGPAVEVVGRIATLRHGAYIDVEDTAVATLKFASGGLAVIHASTTFQPDLGFRVAINGTSGAAVSVWERKEGQLGINDLWSIPGEEELREQWLAEDDGKEGFPEYHVLQVQDFLRAILEDRDPAITGAEARKSLEIILAIYESSRTGLPVAVGRRES
jgi:UDP-N-acetyl-2-amino-2-deoxyglucuronate dehydrogenase